MTSGDHSFSILCIVVMIQVLMLYDLAQYMHIEVRLKSKKGKPTTEDGVIQSNEDKPNDLATVKQNFLSCLELVMNEKYFILNYFNDCQELHRHLTALTVEQLEELPDLVLLMEGYLRHRQLTLIVEPESTMEVFNLLNKTIKDSKFHSKEVLV